MTVLGDRDQSELVLVLNIRHLPEPTGPSEDFLTDTLDSESVQFTVLRPGMGSNTQITRPCHTRDSGAAGDSPTGHPGAVHHLGPVLLVGGGFDVVPVRPLVTVPQQQPEESTTVQGEGQKLMLAPAAAPPVQPQRHQVKVNCCHLSTAPHTHTHTRRSGSSALTHHLSEQGAVQAEPPGTQCVGTVPRSVLPGGFEPATLLELVDGK